MTGSQGPARIVARRTVVAAVGGAGLAVALTACGGSDDGGQTVGAQPAGGDAGGDAVGKVLAKTTDIPEGGGKVIGNVVVTQPKPGEFKAFSSKCTHQGCAVKDVSNGVIHCPCHGSQFDASDGSVKTGPATTALPTASITVDGGSIKLA
ncbi:MULTISPECIES: Rieske (2Fe-2S) protein [unclassified Streptomyces]|uniref:Rieske (2Fe-2S) protein n=1 Tax=unclassified Streptomyces TaxID=2593676 RepID=UPI002DD88846|nr:Rieske (2Fe-2S) protein [Streptomyces sp. NBC_01750]WSB04115.1 Rieske (2Fe-2S) protein [Streptomyces sp. NBC_01794]WSD31600.1 Rieske (2Fe-2S) protein [Streptomyces sp. NBC_01750]